VKKAFLVIIDYPADSTIHEPHIGDIHWSIIGQHWWDKCGWDAHTTEATAEMLAHHGVPYAPECRTCNDFRQVFASRDVERPELDRWYACPDCTTPENVEEP
jgi:hypothetical protein